jgi:hypothetical protein
MAALAWVLAIALLLGYEWFALATGRKTLSRQMTDWSQGWPLVPWLVGVVMGGLAVHFFWHWCP